MRPSSSPGSPAKDPAWIRRGARDPHPTEHRARAAAAIRASCPAALSLDGRREHGVGQVPDLLGRAPRAGRLLLPTLVSQARRPRRARARRPPRFSGASRAPFPRRRQSRSCAWASSRRGSLKRSVPSFLYTVQNNCSAALKHLDAAPYQVRGRLSPAAERRASRRRKLHRAHLNNRRCATSSRSSRPPSSVFMLKRRLTRLKCARARRRARDAGEGEAEGTT